MLIEKLPTHFRFFFAWCRNPSSVDVVKTTWQLEVRETPKFQITKKDLGDEEGPQGMGSRSVQVL